MLLRDRVAHTGVTRPQLTRGSLGQSPGSFEGGGGGGGGGLRMPTGSSGGSAVNHQGGEGSGVLRALSHFIFQSRLSGTVYVFRFDISVIYDALCIWFGLYGVLSLRFLFSSIIQLKFS